MFHVFPILCPFLSNIAVAGDGDGIVSASDMEALAQALPKSTSATVANAGHVPMLEARPKLDSIRRCMALLLLDSSHRWTPKTLFFVCFCLTCKNFVNLVLFKVDTQYSIVFMYSYMSIQSTTSWRDLEYTKNPLGTLWDWNKIERYRGAWQSGSSLAQVDSVDSGKSQDMWRVTFRWDVCVVWMTG